MADIEISCVACQHKLSVSEFTDAHKFVCPRCGADIPNPGVSAIPQAKPRLLRPVVLSLADAAEARRTTPQKRKSHKKTGTNNTRKHDANETVLPENLREEARIARVANSRRQKRSKRARGQKPAVAWVLFVVIGSITGVLRYGGFVPGLSAVVRQYGFYGIVLLYIILAIKAFEDSAFNGVLAIVFPPYALYHLITVSDDFILRAIVCGTLVGVGQDAGLSTRNHFAAAHHKAYRWISDQGEMDVMDKIEQEGR